MTDNEYIELLEQTIRDLEGAIVRVYEGNDVSDARDNAFQEYHSIMQDLVVRSLARVATLGVLYNDNR